MMNSTRQQVGLRMICLACCLSTPAIATAGQVLPTWSQQVTIAQSSPSNILTDSYSASLLTIIYAINGAEGEAYEGLVDYQGYSGPVVLHVLQASYTPPTFEPVPALLDVYSFPASAQPPQLNCPPVGTFLTEIDVPIGNYFSSPYNITLPGQNTSGGECYLISGDFAYLDVPSFFSISTVPEPSSFLMLGTATVILAACARRRVLRSEPPVKPLRPVVASM
jgi:PEP-CTERM motif